MLGVMSNDTVIQAFGGVIALLWLVTGVITIIAAKRVTRLASAPPILYAYAPAKFSVLMAILLWAVIEVFFDFWWIAPDARPWPTILVHTSVEGLCRPVLFGVIIAHWRTPLSSYIVSRYPDAFESATDQQMVQHTVPPRPQPSQHGAGELRHRRDATYDHVAAPRDQGGASAEGGEEPSSNDSDPKPGVSGTVATDIVDEAAVQRRLRRLVVSRPRVVIAVIVILLWMVLHVGAAIVQGISTNINTLKGCSEDDSYGINLCVVPLDGPASAYQPPIVSTAVNKSVNGTSLNGTWVTTMISVAAPRGSELKVHVVPCALLELAASVQIALIGVLWYISGRSHQKALISRVAVRGFSPFHVVTSALILAAAVFTVPMIFVGVREQGAAYSSLLLLRRFADVICVGLIAGRAFRQRIYLNLYVPPSLTSVG